MRSYKFGIGVASVGVAATLLAAASSYGGAPAAKNQQQAPESASIGFVDLNQISEEIKKTPSWQKMVQKATEARTRYSTELDDMVQRRHLTEAELKELAELQAKAKPTDAEKEKVTKLLRKSDDLDKEFNDLANTSPPTPQQTQRMQELNELRTKAGQKLQTARGEREAQLQEMEGDMLGELQTKILKVVSDSAKNQNIEIVVDKQALLYGGRDLTQTVIAKMPKN
jgi:Skp family chaperone for outer membrane proteins